MWNKIVGKVIEDAGKNVSAAAGGIRSVEAQPDEPQAQPLMQEAIQPTDTRITNQARMSNGLFSRGRKY